jgi:hypothetical protein
MIYVIDTSSLIVLKNFYPKHFPSLWKGIDGLVKAERLISVREVLNELDSYNDTDFIQGWAEANKPIFLIPGNQELLFVSQMFQVKHFQTLISQKNLLTGKPIADPFVIAAGKIKAGCVITQEILKPNAAKIPNICEHFGIKYMNLEGLMKTEGWTF